MDKEKSRYTLGLDFGTNSVRALIVDVSSGQELATSVWSYEHGESGVLLDDREPHLARQHPQDYLQGTEIAVRRAVAKAELDPDFSAQRVIGIGVDTTGSTPLPVDETGTPLALKRRYEDNPAAMAWLWKDHTAHAEAEEITELARDSRPHYLAKCGEKYSSEWFWSKLLHCRRTAPDVFEAAFTWLEISDWIPAALTDNELPHLKRGICPAGHKAMFHPAWKGYPDEPFLANLDPQLSRVRQTLPDRAYTVADAAGALSPKWSRRLGLPKRIPVAVGALDAHLGAVGSGIAPGILVKIIGTSTCDMMVWPLQKKLPDIPGLCGSTPESILPGAYGLEAGQSAVGDIFNWFVSSIQPAGNSHQSLTQQAASLRPGESGLLGLDWQNGNRTVLIDQRLTGALIGTTLHTTPAEIYRALIEATAFGARVIMERFEKYGLRVESVVNCGGVSIKNSLLMQIYADACNRTMHVSGSEQTCALGAAMAGAVVAGAASGGHASFSEAIAAMTTVDEVSYFPDPKAHTTYDRLYTLYRRLHDIFGTRDYSDNLFDVMKELLRLRDEARRR